MLGQERSVHVSIQQKRAREEESVLSYCSCSEDVIVLREDVLSSLVLACVLIDTLLSVSLSSMSLSSSVLLPHLGTSLMSRLDMRT